jgi:hypothetical protein
VATSPDIGDYAYPFLTDNTLSSTFKLIFEKLKSIDL